MLTTSAFVSLYEKFRNNFREGFIVALKNGSLISVLIIVLQSRVPATQEK